MRKLNLAALSYDRNGILNALQRTNAVEIKEHADLEGTLALPDCAEELRAYHASLEAALEVLTSYADASFKEQKQKPEADGFAVTYAEFAAAGDLQERADTLVRTLGELIEEQTRAGQEEARLVRAIAAAKPYAGMTIPFSAYAPTRHTVPRLGLVASAAWDILQKELDELPLTAYEATKGEDCVLLTVFAHKSVLSEAETLLSNAGFAACTYTGDQTGAEQLEALNDRLKAEQKKQREAEKNICALASEIRTLRLYADYVGFELEKAEAAGKMRGTARTFFLEAFVPESEEMRVRTALDHTMYAIWYEFSDPAEDEEIPTLLKNNAVVQNFEAITNMYSPPAAREFDPNTVMAFFYSLFLGFIMGDIGYGLLMIIGGGALYFRSRKGSAVKSLAGVFAVGGVFAIIWGFLFNSLFGMAPFPYKLMPEVQSEMYSLMGVKIPGMLIIAMLVGIVHLLVGYVCRAVQSWRKGDVLDGIFDGLTWALFSLGVALALTGLVEEFDMPSLVLYIGGIMAGASLLLAVVTAGRKEKFLGKFTKGFGSLYGVINYVSDILSYARLYGLMLSGAVIAQIISNYSIQFIQTSIPLAILGVVLMVVGHIFNLAIGLLGAYIHDARLQYVEFYGRFYAGEGTLFTPLGSQRRHVLLEEETA